MDERLARVESELTAIKVDVAVIKANGATNADVAEAKSSIIIWVSAAIFLAQLLPAVLKLFVR